MKESARKQVSPHILNVRGTSRPLQTFKAGPRPKLRRTSEVRRTLKALGARCLGAAFMEARSHTFSGILSGASASLSTLKSVQSVKSVVFVL